VSQSRRIPFKSDLNWRSNHPRQVQTNRQQWYKTIRTQDQGCQMFLDAMYQNWCMYVI
jgi:hypothetical protein